MTERGQIREGFWADLVLFDPDTIIDGATYDNPQTEPDGIRLVVVNGAVAYERPDNLAPGVHTGVGTGQMLRFRKAAYTPA